MSTYRTYFFSIWNFTFFMLSFMETEAFKVLKGHKNTIKMVHVTNVLYSRSSECI